MFRFPPRRSTLDRRRLMGRAELQQWGSCKAGYERQKSEQRRSFEVGSHGFGGIYNSVRGGTTVKKACKNLTAWVHELPYFRHNFLRPNSNIPRPYAAYLRVDREPRLATVGLRSA